MKKTAYSVGVDEAGEKARGAFARPCQTVCDRRETNCRQGVQLL